MISTVDIETTYDTNFNPSPFIATNKIVSVGINKEYYFLIMMNLMVMHLKVFMQFKIY